MAAGRNGSYRDNEVRERKSDVEFTEKRDFYYSNGFDRERNFGQEQSKTREIERERERNSRERFGIRPKDIKERIVINNGYHSSSSTSNSDSKSGDLSSRRVGLSARLADREPGELSSGSGSDDTIASGSLMKGIEVISGFQNRVHSPPGKKRKFSPIVWDREKKTLPVTLSKDGTVSTDLPLPPPPPLPESFHQSLNTIPEGGMLISAIKPIRLPSPLPLIPKPLIGSGMVGPAASESPESLSTSPQDHRWSNAQEPGQLEEDDFVSSRNISSSRWAEDESMSPGDDEMPRKRKKMTGSGFPETKLKTNTSTPVLGELNREGLDRTRARSLGSDGGRDVGSGSEAEYPGNDSGKNDNMEIDEDKEIVCHSDTESDEKDDSQRTSEIKAPPQRCINMLQGCRSVDEYERLNKIDEGTYGVVYRAKDKKTGEIVALKKVKMEKEREGFPLTSLREINILLSFHHPSIVDVKEVVVGSNLDSIFMVMEYMEHDLKALMETMKQPFSQSEVKCLMLQLLEGVKYLHDNWVLHRDLKTSNLLLNNKGELKICDFGLSRQYGSPLKPYTHLVVTLWYRAPELLLGAKQYSTAIDMWSLGCIMGELLSKEPLFNGKTEIDQLDKIFRMLGTPSEAIWPGYSKLPGVKVNFVKQKYNMLRKKFPATSFTGSPILSESGFDLLNKLLTYDPEQRITAGDALNHEWFREVPLPKSKDFMPTFPAQHAQDRRQRRVMRSPDPLEEQRRKELQQRELGTTGLFG